MLSGYRERLSMYDCYPHLKRQNGDRNEIASPLQECTADNWSNAARYCKDDFQCAVFSSRIGRLKYWDGSYAPVNLSNQTPRLLCGFRGNSPNYVSRPRSPRNEHRRPGFIAPAAKPLSQESDNLGSTEAVWENVSFARIQ